MKPEDITNEAWQKAWDINVKHIDKLESKLDRIRQWCDLYPIDSFLDPDVRYIFTSIIRIIEED